VGGGPETKSVFHLTRGPMSLPSFVQDVAWAFAEWVNEESYNFAAGLKAEYPMVAREGGKEPLRAEYSAYTMGSDHDVYQDSSFGIPAIYLNDWPDRFIHTNLDAPANIDATKLKRAGFIGAASGYFLAGINADNLKAINSEITVGRYLRGAALRERTRGLTAKEVCAPTRGEMAFEKKEYRSVQIFLEMESVQDSTENLAGDDCFPGEVFNEHTGPPPTYRRKAKPEGPLAVFGYDYFNVEWTKRGHTTKPKLLEYEGLWGGGEEYAYEVLNFADGIRNAQQIRDAVAAEYGPVPLELVVEYLKALQEIGVVEKIK
jgi:aminopeptidase YwaD